MKYIAVAAALVIATAGVTFAATPMPLKGSSYLAQAKIPLDRARQIALAKERGTIVDQELERENGGLRYSFDVKVGGVVREVGVDAVTGEIVEDSIDNGND